MAISLEPGARPPAQAATGAVAPSATETRLRLIIESAPVSLTVTTQDGTILAANARALRLFQVERLENLVGTKFDRLIAADDRPRVVSALEGVYKGADAHLTYRVAAGASAGRGVEMRAVPLRRDGTAPAVCLAATWEIAENAGAETAVKPAGSPALEQALEEAKAALASMTRTREAERLAVGDALLQTRQRMQAALAEAEERHTQAAAQWATERDTLQANAAQARDRADAAASQVAALGNDLTQARDTVKATAARLESSQAELAKVRDAAHQAVSSLQARESELAQVRDAAAAAASQLTAANGELAKAREAATAVSSQLAAVSADLAQTRDAAMMTAAQLATSNEQRVKAEEALEASKYRVAELEAIVRELEERASQLIADRKADRVEFHEMVRTEQSKYQALASHQAERDAALADISRLLQDVSHRTERLLGDKPVIVLDLAPVPAPASVPVPAPPQQNAGESAAAQPQAAAPVEGPIEEDPWQF
jgi:PAS domain S-box-containing protein